MISRKEEEEEEKKRKKVSFIIDRRFDDAHTPLDERQKGDSVICHFFFPRNWRLKSLCTEMRSKGSGWSSTVIRLNEASREGKFYRDTEQSMILHGIISGFEREKIIAPVEQIKFLTNALNTLALYCSFNPVSCFPANPCESLMNSYDSGRENWLESSLTSRRNSL